MLEIGHCRAERELIAAYRQAQLRLLLEHVRAGFAQLDAGEIDEFDLDDLVHHYERPAAGLWRFCGSTGGQWHRAADSLTYMREHGEQSDCWERGRLARHQNVLICALPASEIGGQMVHSTRILQFLASLQLNDHIQSFFGRVLAGAIRETVSTQRPLEMTGPR